MATSKDKGAVNIDLPYDRNGEVDWNTLGNILTAHLLGEVLCASYVDRRHNQRKVDFQADTDWKFLYEKDEVVVLIKQFTKTQLTTVIGRGVVDAPLHDVVALIKDIRNNHVWDKYIVEAKYLKVLSQSETHTDYIALYRPYEKYPHSQPAFVIKWEELGMRLAERYQRFDATKCFVPVKRDILYYVRCIYIDGKYVQTSISVEDPDYPAHPDVTRVQAFPGTGFVVEPYEGSSSKTLLNYLGNGDFSKGLPQFMKTLILKKHHALTIRQIRRHFVRAEKRQQQKEAHRKEQQMSSQHLFVRSTLAESSATPQLPWIKPYEEDMPIGDFMMARSGIRSHSEPIQTLDQDLSTSPELRVHSAISPHSEDLSNQSRTSSVSEFYPPTRGEVRQDKNMFSDIGNDHIVDNGTAIQTDNDPDLVDC